MEALPAETPGDREIPRSSIAALAAIIVAITWSYWPSFRMLLGYWQGDDNYGHGWFVIPIAAAILWQRRDRLDTLSYSPNRFGFILLAATVAVRYWLYEKNYQWFETAMLPVLAGAVMLALGGWRLLAWGLPAVVFLFFMLPLPGSLNDVLAGPLQSLATKGSVNLLHAAGVAVLSEGNVIIVGTQRLEVAEACRGLSMLLSFATLITAMVILVERPLLDRLVLLVSIIPIALLCNILRITITAICYKWFGHEVKVVHDWAGYAMMPMALGFVLLELKILSWVIIEVEVAERPALIRTTFEHGRS